MGLEGGSWNHSLTSSYQFEPRGISNEGHLTGPSRRSGVPFYGLGLPNEVVDFAGAHCAEVLHF